MNDAATPRVAYFPDAYHEIDGVANTARQFEGFARLRDIPFLMVFAGPRDEVTTAGSVTRVQLKRGPVRFALDGAHQYDLLFQRHRRKVMSLVSDFNPDVVQITGPTDVGTLGAMISHKLQIPLAATWQTNLPLYAKSRAAKRLAWMPEWAVKSLANAAEHWAGRATVRFYKWPQLLFAPNSELVRSLQHATGKPCYLMSHSVDTEVFSPKFRDRPEGKIRIGYVGRLTPEKNVRWLARLEETLTARGHDNFEFVVVGAGEEASWLRANLRRAEFTGQLTGAELSRAFANMDIFAFPSQTETFGLVVLEAMASGVPIVVTAGGGPKHTVQMGRTGFVAGDFEEFAGYVEVLLAQPDRLLAMRQTAREYALSTSWPKIFDGMYQAYRTLRHAEAVVQHGMLGAVNP